jgi:hypothetical protein
VPKKKKNAIEDNTIARVTHPAQSLQSSSVFAAAFRIFFFLHRFPRSSLLLEAAGAKMQADEATAVALEQQESTVIISDHCTYPHKPAKREYRVNADTTFADLRKIIITDLNYPDKAFVFAKGVQTIPVEQEAEIRVFDNPRTFVMLQISELYKARFHFRGLIVLVSFTLFLFVYTFFRCFFDCLNQPMLSSHLCYISHALFFFFFLVNIRVVDNSHCTNVNFPCEPMAVIRWLFLSSASSLLQQRYPNGFLARENTDLHVHSSPRESSAVVVRAWLFSALMLFSASDPLFLNMLSVHLRGWFPLASRGTLPCCRSQKQLVRPSPAEQHFLVGLEQEVEDRLRGSQQSGFACCFCFYSLLFFLLICLSRTVSLVVAQSSNDRVLTLLQARPAT